MFWEELKMHYFTNEKHFTVPVDYMSTRYSIVISNGSVDKKMVFNTTLLEKILLIPVNVLKEFLNIRALSRNPIILGEDGCLSVCLRKSTCVKFSKEGFSVICPINSREKNLLNLSVPSQEPKRVSDDTYSYCVSDENLKNFIWRLNLN